MQKIIAVHFLCDLSIFHLFLNINLSLNLLIIKAIFFSFFSPTVCVVKYIVCVHTLGSIQYIVLSIPDPQKFLAPFSLYNRVYLQWYLLCIFWTQLLVLTRAIIHLSIPRCVLFTKIDKIKQKQIWSGGGLFKYLVYLTAHIQVDGHLKSAYKI